MKRTTAIYILGVALLATATGLAARNGELAAREEGLGAQATAHGIQLTWTNPNSIGTVNVYRNAGTTCSSGALVGNSSTPAGPFEDSNPLVGIQSYQVTAVINGVESSKSNCATVTSTVLPQPITGLAGTNN